MQREIFDLQGAAQFLVHSPRWLRENCVKLGIGRERVGRKFRIYPDHATYAEGSEPASDGYWISIAWESDWRYGHINGRARWLPGRPERISDPWWRLWKRIS